MGLARKLARLGRRLLGQSVAPLESPIDGWRICRVEELEPRQMMAADIQLGAVYYDPAPGLDQDGNTFTVTWNGGATGTELSQLVINTDKNGNGQIDNGEAFFDTADGGQGVYGNMPFTVISSGGVTVTNVQQGDGAQKLVLDFSGFTAGKTLTFKIDVDEQGLDSHGNPSVSAVVEGQEFEESVLQGTFVNPDYFDATGSGIFKDKFDPQLAASGLPLPHDNYMPPSDTDLTVLTAGAMFPIPQTPKPGSIEGIVYVDKNGDGLLHPNDPLLSGVTMQLLNAQHTIIATTTTDINGHYKFDNLTPGTTYSVHEVQPAGYFQGSDWIGSLGGNATPPDDLTTIPVGPNQHGINYNFYEIPPDTISGQVKIETFGDCETHPEDPGLAGVTIQLLDATGTVIGTTTTDVNGNYQFVNLRPGDYSVRELVPTGLLPGDAHVGDHGGTVIGMTEVDGAHLVNGVDGLHYDFCVVPPNTISGQVKIETFGDCETHPEDPGLAGVTIQLLDATGTVIKTTTTDANGNYKFDMLYAGYYSVREIVPTGLFADDDHVGDHGGVTNGPTELDNAYLLGGVDGLHYDFCLIPPNSISGQVKIETFGDCETHPEDPGLAGVTILLLDSTGTTIATTTTDVNGFYKFDKLMPGDYSVREIVPTGLLAGDDHVGDHGGVLNGLTEIDHATLLGGVDALHYDFCIIPPDSIAGTVKVEVYGDCDTHPEDPGLAGVTIQLLDSHGTLVATTTTDVNGNYKFSNLMPDDYSVRELVPAGYVASDDHVGTAGGALNGLTEVDGAHLLGGIDALHYDFCLYVPNSIAGFVKVEKGPDWVTNPASPPLAGVTIQLFDSSNHLVATTTTLDDGSYLFTNLAPDTYRVHEVVPSGYLASDDHLGSIGGLVDGLINLESITLHSDTHGVHYDFAVIQPGSISGIVFNDIDGNCETNPNEPRLSGVTVQLLDSKGNVIATTVTNSKGEYLFDDLLPGTYSVHDLVPAGFSADDAHAGSIGGVVVGATLVTHIGLTTGTDATLYNFCVAQPATLSGIVFQDGPAIFAFPGQVVTAQSAGRDGIYRSGDPLIAGVTLVLADANGVILTDSSGVPIQTTTDANGFYQFTGLKVGTYTVFELPPGGYIVGLETAGSTGGSALNPGALRPLGFASTSETAIAGIPLLNGQSSVMNNFSVLLVVPFTIPPQDTPAIPPALRSIPPAIFPTTFVQPQIAPIAPGVSYYSGGGGDGWTWHLSVINAGQPRQGEGQTQLTAQQRAEAEWEDELLTQSEWELAADEEGKDPQRFVFGMRGGIPVTGDFNGDGISDLGVFLRGQWFIDLNGNGVWDKEDLWAKLGYQDDLPITGDWDGDGKTDIGIYGHAWPGDPRAVANEPGLPDPDNKNANVRKNAPPREQIAPHGWRQMQRTSTGKVRADLIDHVFFYGVPGDHPLAGDWNGAGVDTIGIFRDGRWDLDVDGNGKWSPGDITVQMGQAGDLPIVGDFNGDGRDEIGVYRGGTWYIDINSDLVLDEKDVVVKLGEEGDLPVVGDWNGDGLEEIGVYKNGRLVPASQAAIDQALEQR